MYYSAPSPLPRSERSPAHQGDHHILWHLPDVLRFQLASSSLRHLVDWIPRRLPALLRRHRERPSHGCRLFPHHHHARRVPHCVGVLHDVSMHNLLAVGPRPGDLHWHWQRMLAHAHDGRHLDVLWAQAAARHGDCGVRECGGRSRLHWHGEGIAAEHWLWVDAEGDCVYSTGHAGARHAGGTAETSTAGQGRTGTALGGFHCFPGARV